MTTENNEVWEIPFLDPVHEFREDFLLKVKPYTELTKLPPKMLAEMTGQDLGTCSWTLTMTTIFFLSLMLNFIKHPQLRKWYSSSIGLFFGFYVYGAGYFWVIAMFVTVWPLMAFLPRE